MPKLSLKEFAEKYNKFTFEQKIVLPSTWQTVGLSAATMIAGISIGEYLGMPMQNVENQILGTIISFIATPILSKFASSEISSEKERIALLANELGLNTNDLQKLFEDMKNNSSNEMKLHNFIRDNLKVKPSEKENTIRQLNNIKLLVLLGLDKNVLLKIMKSRLDSFVPIEAFEGIRNNQECEKYYHLLKAHVENKKLKKALTPSFTAFQNNSKSPMLFTNGHKTSINDKGIINLVADYLIEDPKIEKHHKKLKQ